MVRKFRISMEKQGKIKAKKLKIPIDNKEQNVLI